MRKVAIASVSMVVAFLMLVPNGVSADNLYLEVEDRIGDVAFAYDYEIYDYRVLLGENSPIVQAGYFDMTLFWLGLKGKTYTYGMQLAADLPEEGAPLPSGVKVLQYTLWLDKEVWDWYPGTESYFAVMLQYDGTEYFAALLDGSSWAVKMQLPFEIDGPRFEVTFSADSIDNIESFWLVACVVALHGEALCTAWPDGLDYDAGAPGQVITSIPWPPPEE